MAEDITTVGQILALLHSMAPRGGQDKTEPLSQPLAWSNTDTGLQAVPDCLQTQVNFTFTVSTDSWKFSMRSTKPHIRYRKETQLVEKSIIYYITYENQHHQKLKKSYQTHCYEYGLNNWFQLLAVRERLLYFLIYKVGVTVIVTLLHFFFWELKEFNTCTL